MTIRAVVFDFGGVLLRTEDQFPRQQLAKHLGIPMDQLYYQIFSGDSAHRAMIGEISAEAHWDAVRNALGIGEDEFSEAQEAFWSGDRLDEELIEYLRSLRPHYRTALLSNAWDDLRSVIQNNWDIDDVFDEMIISAEVGIAKPDPRIYQIVLDRLGVLAEEVVFVDDFIENIESANILGFKTVHYQGEQRMYADLDVILNGE